MAQSQINWKRSDYAKLSRAVRDFNKKVSRLQQEENKLYLPETVSYQEAKENITTRNELNRVINSLRRFQREGAEDLYITMSGESMTKWERKELGIQSRIAQSRLTRELKALNVPDESGYSRAQMGSSRAREIEAQIKNLKDIESKTGYEFRRQKERIMSQGQSDYVMKKAIIYRENYLKELEKYSHLDNYDLLMKKLNSLTNPLSFFEFMSKDEMAQDLTYQSDQYLTQEGFNNYLRRLGILDENFSSVEEARQAKFERMTYSGKKGILYM